jgi:hypothetical protein
MATGMPAASSYTEGKAKSIYKEEGLKGEEGLAIWMNRYN